MKNKYKAPKEAYISLTLYPSIVTMIAGGKMINKNEIKLAILSPNYLYFSNFDFITSTKRLTLLLYELAKYRIPKYRINE